ncbi:MAG: glucose-1-phosphate thymidylyltransferase RfbA [Pseudomonadales bacterium]
MATHSTAPATNYRGIILAGGSGTRLHPVTQAVCKQLLPVYDKPMVYYPLSTLMLAGIREILIISTPLDLPRFRSLLGTGEQWGLELSYAEQSEPRGLADAFNVGADYLQGHGCVMVLGDNIFFADGLSSKMRSAIANNEGATLFSYPVSDPERFGVVVLDDNGQPLDLIEKPDPAPSNLAVTGLYIYGPDVVEQTRELQPSTRGELEITDLNRRYLGQGRLRLEALRRGTAWLDTGTHDALLEASQFVQTIQHRQGLIIASPEEIAWRMDWISRPALLELARGLSASHYQEYLIALASGSDHHAGI